MHLVLFRTYHQGLPHHRILQGLYQVLDHLLHLLVRHQGYLQDQHLYLRSLQILDQSHQDQFQDLQALQRSLLVQYHSRQYQFRKCQVQLYLGLMHQGPHKLLKKCRNLEKCRRDLRMLMEVFRTFARF